MLDIPFLSPQSPLPSPHNALVEPNGLLAFGHDLTTSRLVEAYSKGIFPWFSPGEPVLWWSPDPRGIITYDSFYINKSLRKFIKRNNLEQRYSITLNRAFSDVIRHCANVKRSPIWHDDGSCSNNGTWITADMQQAYINLHKAGYAHSIEVWEANQLVGGLYGVVVKGVFCGESMFHLQPNTSKLAFVKLVEHCKKIGIDFIDCQMTNPYLESLGCIELPRQAFLTQLSRASSITIAQEAWSPQGLS